MNGENQGDNLKIMTGSLGSNQQFGEQKPKNTKRRAVWIIAILAMLAVVFTSALVSKIWDPSWNPFRPSPEELLYKAIAQMAEIKTMHAEADIEIQVRGAPGIGDMKIGIRTQGDTDASDPQNPKSQMEYELAITAQGTEFFVTGEMREIDEVSYFKLDTIPLPIMLVLASAGISSEEWLNQWFHLDPRELGMRITIDHQELEEKIIALLKEYPILKFKRALPDEVFQETRMYRYVFTLDPEEFKPFMTEFVDIVGENIMGAGSRSPEIKEKEKQEIYEDLDEMFEIIGDIDFEFYIGKEDLMIHRITSQTEIEAPEEVTQARSEAQPETVVLAADFRFSRFNEPIDIQVPEGSISIMSILMPIFEMFMMPSRGYQEPSPAMPYWETEDWEKDFQYNF